MWLAGFEAVTFPQSLGFPHRGHDIRGVGWHTTEGWNAEGAFGVYARAIKGANPNVTVAFREAFGGSTDRQETRRRFQHVDTLLASYAFEHGNELGHACRVETNASGIIQIERVGFAGDDVSIDELRWLGEEVLAPILRAHPEIPPWVYIGPRMTEDELDAWSGGQVRHRDMPCQPEKHSDPGDLDLHSILHFALELLDRETTEPQIEPDMILLRVVNDPNYQVPAGPDGKPGEGSGVQLEVNSNGLVWVRSGVVEPIYLDGGVRKVDVTVDEVHALLLHKPGIGPPPSQAVPPSVIHWP